MRLLTGNQPNPVIRLADKPFPTMSNVVNHLVNTHLGTPETMMNGFAGIQVAEMERAPAVDAAAAKKKSQRRRFMLPMRP